LGRGEVDSKDERRKLTKAVMESASDGDRPEKEGGGGGGGWRHNSLKNAARKTRNLARNPRRGLSSLGLALQKI
jgi:hypothetical protein